MDMIAKLRFMLYCRGYVADPVVDTLDSLDFNSTERKSGVIHRETGANNHYATIIFVLNNANDVVKQDYDYVVTERARIAEEYAAEGIVCDRVIVIYKNGIHYRTREMLADMVTWNMVNIEDLEIGLYDHMFSPRQIRKLSHEEINYLASEISMTVDQIKSGGIPILYATRHVSSYLHLREGDVVLSMEPSIAKYDEEITLVDGSTTVINSMIDFPKYYIVKRIRPDEEERHRSYVKEAQSDRDSKKSIRQIMMEYEGDDDEEDVEGAD